MNNFEEANEKIREFILTSPVDEVITHIGFDFDTIGAWNGLLETRLCKGEYCVELPLNSFDLKNRGFELNCNDELKMEALRLIKEKLEIL